MWKRKLTFKPSKDIIKKKVYHVSCLLGFTTYSVLKSTCYSFNQNEINLETGKFHLKSLSHWEIKVSYLGFKYLKLKPVFGCHSVY